MASVSSLDHDMRKLRLDRYTPGAAKEVRSWIEDTLGELLEPGDLMEALRDGVALCKLVNRAVSPGVKFKASNMPFVQMENISHFLRACEMPPLNLPAHDRFLTVDLYDSKDPAQVLQCIAAFSRRANVINPSAFPTTIGAKSKGSSVSPQGTGSSQGAYGQMSPQSGYVRNTPTKIDTTPNLAFNSINRASYSSGQISPTKASSLSRGGPATGGPVSSWSSKEDEGKTAPAWNIHQYGYMGGASQGNQGIAFGARRQITSQAPEVPSIAEKEKRLREKMEQEQRSIAENEERIRAEQEAEEARAREQEEARWAEETRKMRAVEEKERLQREKVERLRREEQALREAEVETRLAAERAKEHATSDARLNGQFLSQYQASQTVKSQPIQPAPSAESERIAELERQLAELKQQNAARETQIPKPVPQPELPIRNQAAPPSADKATTSHEDDWDASERDYLKKSWKEQQILTEEYRSTAPSQHLPRHERPDNPTPHSASSRPLPDPSNYAPGTNRTDRFLSTNPAPPAANIRSNRPTDFSTTTEVDLEDQRRLASQSKTKAGGWASKSLLEREMERERERQREWEEAQKATETRARDLNHGSGPGQSWDVNQYGFTGGDSQNRGGTGISVGSARRQIIGPRPPP